MRRAFGNNRRMGGGGGMMRKTIGRAIGVNGNGVQEPVTTRPNNKAINSVLSLSTCSSTASSVAATTTNQISPLSYQNSYNSNSYYDNSNDHWDWETVDEIEDYGGHGCNGGDRFVFGPVPSKDEVEDAVSSLHHVLGPATYYQLTGRGFSSESETSSPPTSEPDWLEPSLFLSNSSMHQGGCVVDAFRLLQTEPTIQRAVVSLSTDKAVWDAVLNNDVVRELRDTYEAENKLEKIDGTSTTDAKGVLSWILDNGKATLMEIIKMLTDVFQPSGVEKDKAREAEAEVETTKTATRDEFQERLKSSLLLSIVVLLIVVMTRARS